MRCLFREYNTHDTVRYDLGYMKYTVVAHFDGDATIVFLQLGQELFSYNNKKKRNKTRLEIEIDYTSEITLTRIHGVTQPSWKK